jgi:hypothetical protein
VLLFCLLMSLAQRAFKAPPDLLLRPVAIVDLLHARQLFQAEFPKLLLVKLALGVYAKTPLLLPVL